LDGKAPSFAPETDSPQGAVPALLVSISKLAETEYNLSADRYREVIRVGKQTYPLVKLEEVATLYNGRAYKQEELLEDESKTPVLRVGNLFTNNSWYYSDLQLDENKYCSAGDLLYAWSASFGPFIWDGPKSIYHYHIWKVEHSDKIEKKFLYHMLQKATEAIKGESHGIAMLHMTKANMEKIQIPLPPLETQHQLVDEIAAHQRVIDGARQVVENWSPDIELELENVLKNAEEIIWKRVPLAEVCEQITDGTHVTPKYTESGVPFLRVTDITESNDSKKYISIEEHGQLIKRCKPVKGDVLYSKNGTIGVAKLIDWDWEFSIFVSLAMLKPKRDILDGKYLEFFLNSDDGYAQATAHSKSGTVTNLHLVEIKQMEIPLPPLEIQREIVARIETERAIVHGNRELIRLYEEKVKKVIERVWEG